MKTMLKDLKLPEAARKIEQGIAETLTYLLFPSKRWMKMRTTDVEEHLNREIQRRIRVVVASPDGNSTLKMVCARLRHIAGTAWGIKRYMNMTRLDELKRGGGFFIFCWLIPSYQVVNSSTFYLETLYHLYPCLTLTRKYLILVHINLFLAKYERYLKIDPLISGIS